METSDMQTAGTHETALTAGPPCQPFPVPHAAPTSGQHRSGTSAQAVVTRPDLIPTPALRARLEGHIARRNRLGDVYAGLKRGESRLAIAAVAGTRSPNWVRNKEWTIEALFFGRLRTSYYCRKAVLEDLGGMEARAQGDPEVLWHIRRVKAALLELPEPDGEGAPSALTAPAGSPVPRGCVYVAVLPTYYQLLSAVKVGCRRAAADPTARVAGLRATGSPEGPLMPRWYLPPVGKTAEWLEWTVHGGLRAQGRGLQLDRGGAEWFIATPADVDALAAAAGAERVIGPDDAAVEALSSVLCPVLELADIIGDGRVRMHFATRGQETEGAAREHDSWAKMDPADTSIERGAK